MILYKVTTEKGNLLAYFLLESLAILYCKQGRNLKYEKIEIPYHKIISLGDEDNDCDWWMDKRRKRRVA